MKPLQTDIHTPVAGRKNRGLKQRSGLALTRQVLSTGTEKFQESVSKTLPEEQGILNEWLTQLLCCLVYLGSKSFFSALKSLFILKRRSEVISIYSGEEGFFHDK